MPKLRVHLNKKQKMIALVILILILGGGGFLLWGRSDKKTANNSIAGSSNGTSNTSQGGSGPDGNGQPSSSTEANKKTPGSSSTSSSASGGSSSSSGGSSTPALPPAVAVANFSGNWYDNFGYMTLTQSGTQVSGTYTNSPNGYTGTVSGTATLTGMTGNWVVGSNHGTISWSTSDGGNTITGNYGGSYKWCGAKIGVTFPTNCGFSGHWYIKVGGETCEMNLTRLKNNVDGSYCNGTIDGDITYSGGNTILNGTWSRNGNSGDFRMFLADLDSVPQQTYFQGSYATGAIQWCGATTTSYPSPCSKY